VAGCALTRIGQNEQKGKESMPVKVKDQGQYELFETDHHHQILVLNGKQWYAAVKGQQGDILVHSDSDHKKARTRQKGQFYLIEFKGDPKFKDMPHLFLEKGSSYQELMVPNGLPTEQDNQKKVVWTDDTLQKKELDGYIKHPQPAGPGEERMDRPGGGSVANVAHYLKGIDLPAGKDAVIRYAKDHKAPKAVLNQLEQMNDGRYTNMADVMQALGRVDNSGDRNADNAGRSGQQGQHGSAGLPIENYDDLTVDEITQRLRGLHVDQIKRVRRYEEQHKGRKTVLEATDRKL
jgi:hypothetical protein